jgi:Protein of unknown function (DUF4446)
MGGITADNLEASVHGYYKRVQTVTANMAELESSYIRIAEMAELALGKVGIIRYNPFGDTGGDQSFSLAVLNSRDSGFIITSIHGRGGTRIYMKPVDAGNSNYPLAAEEKLALKAAISPEKKRPDKETRDDQETISD